MDTAAADGCSSFVPWAAAAASMHPACCSPHELLQRQQTFRGIIALLPHLDELNAALGAGTSTTTSSTSLISNLMCRQRTQQVWRMEGRGCWFLPDPAGVALAVVLAWTGFVRAAP